jgi:hypothetical protein
MEDTELALRLLRLYRSLERQPSTPRGPTGTPIGNSPMTPGRMQREVGRTLDFANAAEQRGPTGTPIGDSPMSEERMQRELDAGRALDFSDVAGSSSNAPQASTAAVSGNDMGIGRLVELYYQALPPLQEELIRYLAESFINCATDEQRVGLHNYILFKMQEAGGSKKRRLQF